MKDIFHRLSPSDFVAAVAPAGLSISLADINTLVQIAGGLAGFAYLLWKWRKESKKDETATKD